MVLHGLKGVIAAIATPIDDKGDPDAVRLTRHAHGLLSTGCDGLNLLGTTGEATSFGVAQRMALMSAAAKDGLPLDRMMVGTGTAALKDTVALSRHAAELGFAGVLVLPPFYYKPVKDEGIIAYIGAIVEATASSTLPIYLYNYPALSGVVYSPAIVTQLIENFGSRIAGLKDSSGDLPYARAIAALSPSLRVFPSNEATLLSAREGMFAGCISATANLNSRDCAAAFHRGDSHALARAMNVREMFNGLPLVPGIKFMLAQHMNDEAWTRLVPPLRALTPMEEALLRERAALAS